MYNRKRLRLAGFDYSKPRNYFFTICAGSRNNPFGTIKNKTMHLSPNGIIAMEQWYWLGNQNPYIDLISFVVMPDHVHGIIYINSDYYIGHGRNHSQYDNQYKIKPLPELIGAYKTTVSKRIHLAGDITFKWHNSYYDHIIRNSRSLNFIKNYIEKNPENWTRI